MKVLAVALARVTALSQLIEWDPYGRSYLPDFIKGMVERYGFQSFPKTPEEYSSPNGAVFSVGRMGDINIQSYWIYRGGLVVDTRSSTEDAETVLKDITEWFSENFGAKSAIERITRKFYLSQLEFYSEQNLNALNPKFRPLAEMLANTVSDHLKQTVKFEATKIVLQNDVLKGPTFSLPLSVERLENSLFEENRYFSSAPLPTNEHIAFLEKFESILSG